LWLNLWNKTSTAVESAVDSSLGRSAHLPEKKSPLVGA
jgi:hypothetical protein